MIFGNGPAPSSWAAEQLYEALEENFFYNDSFATPEKPYTGAITRAEFCALASTLYSKVVGGSVDTSNVKFNDTKNSNVLKMAALGVVEGVGDGNFDPNGILTREQAATMLARLANAVGQPLPAKSPAFSDNSAISSWAVDAVGQVEGAGIMNGTGENRFSPQMEYSREQSVLTILRLYHNLKGGEE